MHASITYYVHSTTVTWWNFLHNSQVSATVKCIVITFLPRITIFIFSQLQWNLSNQVTVYYGHLSELAIEIIPKCVIYIQSDLCNVATCLIRSGNFGPKVTGIDKFHCNHPSLVSDVSVLPGISDHEAVCVSSAIKTKKMPPIKKGCLFVE